MKKICIILIAALITGNVFAQAPETMSYQAVIRNSSNVLVTNTQVSIRISILQGTANGNIVYSETQRATSNQNGLITLQIGTGITTDKFSAINWATGTYFIRTETDPTGGENYSLISGISQLMSVPYALFAKTAGAFVPSPVTGGIVLLDNRAPTYIDFAGAASFGLFTSAGAIANTGTTSIKGNIGSGAGAISGFGVPSLVVGEIHIADSLTARASRGLQSASTQLHNRVATVLTHPATFGSVTGETLYPGVYNITAAVTVNGKLILDGKNLPDAQFIIRTAGAFAMAAGSSIALVNGATSDNVFWVLDGAASIGANAIMSGVVVGNAAISVGAGTSLDGRIYSTAGAIAISGTNAIGLAYIIPLRIMPNADIVIKRNVSIGADLNVDSSAYLNKVGGSTTNYGAFTVERNSSTLLTGRLTVNGTTHLGNTLLTDGATTLGSTLNVAGVTTSTNSTQSTGLSNGALVVAGGAAIGGNLNVGGTVSFGGPSTFGGQLHITDQTQSSTTLAGAVIVDGGVGISKNVNVGGKSKFNDSVSVIGNLSSKSFNISGSDAGFLAKIENTDGDKGDGLVIKLGKTNPAWDGSAYLNLTNPAVEVFQGAINTIKGWVIDHNSFQAKQLLTFIPAAYIGGLACNLVNVITPKLNEKLNLPLNLPDLTTPSQHIWGVTEVFPGISFGALGKVPEIDIPALDIPSVHIIGATTLIPTIPQVDCSSFPTFTTPNISFKNVTNTLTNDNQFISFVDKNDRELGSIRAQSVTEWEFNYLNGNYFVNLMASIVGIDVVSGVANVIAGFSDIATSYNGIGVEYASGHGDYAEWLERSDSTEVISAGDIVAVKAGKISKNLKGAEQLLVVSHNPIVLGNSPAKNKEIYGNKIAFMGQVPVKVQGPVFSGDYIIAKSGMKGYGIAVHADKMTDSDYKLSIGRSWESNLNEGPKMVNTLIGVDNGNYFTILKKSKDQTIVLQEKTINLEKRMKLLEAHMNAFLIAETSKKKSGSKIIRNNLK